METGEELPVIISCFSVIFEENQFPLRVYLVHNNPDPHKPDEDEHQYKPEGYGLIGGGGEKGETPFETVKREVKDESGLLTEIATRGGKDSKADEILFESKLVIDAETGKSAINEIYIFHLKRINANSFERIKETDETGRLMLATFGSILTMPLARKKIKNSDGVTMIVENSEGIYFSTRERLFGVAEYLGFDFYELIPNLEEIFPKIKREEIGNYIYNLLTNVIKKKNELYERRAKFLRPDLDDPDEFQEIVERYQPWIAAGGATCQK